MKLQKISIKKTPWLWEGERGIYIFSKIDSMVSSKYVTSSFGSAKFFFFVYKDMFKSFNKSDFSFPAFLYKFFLDFSNKVSDSYESETALFCAKRCQKVPQIFFPKSATISALSATILEIPPKKWHPILILLHFYVTILSIVTKNLGEKLF